MATIYQFAEAGDTANTDGIFFPVGATIDVDLKGITPDEMAASEPALTKEGKFGLSLFNALVDYSTANTVLATTTTIADAAAGPNLINSIYTFNIDFVGIVSDGTFKPLPVPVAGANANSGQLLLTDLFPNASKLSIGDAIGSVGVLVPTSELAKFASLTHAAINLAEDNRDLIYALVHNYFATVEIRDADNASGIVAISLPVNTLGTLPVDAIDPVNPTTGLIDPSAIDFDPATVRGDLYAVTSRIGTITFQTIKNNILQTFDLNVVTL